MLLLFLLPTIPGRTQDDLPDEVLVPEQEYVLEDSVYLTEEAEETPEPEPAPPYVSERPEQGSRSVDWAAATRDLDYSRDRKKIRDRKTQEATPYEPGAGKNWNWLSDVFAGLGNIVQTLTILLAVAGMAYGLYFLYKQPRNRQISRSGVEINWENLDQFLDETELEGFLKEAIQNKAWSQAIRVYFLMVIQSLSQKKAIAWARHKTNRSYLMEMRTHTLAEPFREATGIYEKVWYGNLMVDERTFRTLEPAFQHLLRHSP
ncbi:MAG: DUF4129 domain-containing protein [Saprospiraceae bacterium]|nr:DUF4129 domain-containing protein [Saprospiraceae bacterium]